MKTIPRKIFFLIVNPILLLLTVPPLIILTAIARALQWRREQFGPEVKHPYYDLGVPRLKLPRGPDDD